MGKIEITQGGLCDIDELEQLYDSVNDFLAAGINYPGWRKGTYPTRAEAENGIRDKTLFVARELEIENGKIIGSVILNHRVEKGYNTVKWLIDNVEDTQILVVHTLAVHPQNLRGGVGQALLDFALQYAKSAGMKSIRLDVYEKNAPAIALYEKKGYTYVGTADLGLSEYGLERFRLYELAV